MGSSKPAGGAGQKNGRLGIKPDFKGLQVDPCIPRDWKGFTVTRRFRGTVYNIEVKNPNGVCKGVKKVTVNGKDYPGNIIPLDAGQYTVTVVITLEG